MADKKKKLSTKRFGPRYGRRLKEKLAEIESGHRGRHKCPYCGKKGIKRLALGIWTCRLCKVKFAGKAYSMGKKMITREVPKKVEKEAPKKTEEKEEIKDGKI